MLRRGFGRAGRPGLIGTMARTAVVAGTATAVSGGMQRHQQERAMEQEQAAAYREQQAGPPVQQAQYAPPRPEYLTPPPSPPGSDDLLDKLQQLGDLKDRGLLTDAEFQAQKARLLGS